jgi:hypothetical protein
LKAAEEAKKYGEFAYSSLGEIPHCVPRERSLTRALAFFLYRVLIGVLERLKKPLALLGLDK